ncbi:MAG: sigma-70 family RNA polymerase sigma factor [Planctomycetes bacterium]|nr:sigma-70 family RNA polymerase sigma factor [Planctomycetota bacterium]
MEEASRGDASDGDARSDEVLLEACRDADDGALRRNLGLVVRRHQRALVSYLDRMVGDATAAEDLAQETFVRVFRKARDYRSVARFSTWLYTIATHLALNEIRNRRRRAPLSLDAPAPGGGEERRARLEGREEAPEVAASRGETARVVREALAEVPEPFRAVLVLCDMQGLSYQEAAEVLGCRLGTIRSRLSRARERFGRAMEPRLPSV